MSAVYIGYICVGGKHTHSKQVWVESDMID